MPGFNRMRLPRRDLCTFLLFIAGLGCSCKRPDVAAHATDVRPSVATPATTASTTASGSSEPAVRTAPDDYWTEWARPLVWRREPLECVPVSASVKGQTVKGWKTLTSGTSASLSAISASASDADAVWIVGAEGTILYTVDHGKTFVSCRIDSREALTSVWAASRDEVWILGTDHVFRVESRATLATLSVSLQGHCGTPGNAIFGTASNDVWLANGALLTTKDRGATWMRVPSCGKAFVDGCASEIAGTTTELWTDCPFSASGSRDGGATWTMGGWQPQTEEQMHVSVSSDDVWVIGHSSQRIGRSTDHGATWSNESLGQGPLDRHLWSIWSAGNGWAWIVADGVWARRGKLPWIRESLPDTIHALGGSNEKDVWAVGAKGLVLHRR